MKNRISIKIKHGGSAVYLLKLNGKIVYVGQSASVLRRFAGHRSKTFDEVEIIWANPKFRHSKERALIKLHLPKFNRPPTKHGTLGKYSSGCRCWPCKRAVHVYNLNGRISMKDKMKARRELEKQWLKKERAK